MPADTPLSPPTAFRPRRAVERKCRLSSFLWHYLALTIKLRRASGAEESLVSAAIVLPWEPFSEPEVDKVLWLTKR